MSVPVFDNPPASPIGVVMIIDALTFERLGPVVEHLTIGLIDHVEQITLVTPSRSAQRVFGGPIQLIEPPSSWRQAFLKNRWAGSLQENLGRRIPRVVHAFSKRSLGLAGALSSETSWPVVLHLWDQADLRVGRAISNGTIHRLIAASGPLYQAALQGLASEEQTHLVRPGLLTESTPTCFGRQESRPSILSMSVDSSGGGADRLILAVKLLVSSGYDLMLFLMGQGAAVRRHRRLVESEKLVRHVTFGESSSDWVTLMKAVDIFAVPEKVDYVDVRLLYALAAGCSAVTCATPQSDFMIDEETGLVCTEPTPESLAAAIRRLLDDRPAARKMAHNAQARCKKEHSLSAMAESTARIYQAMQLQTRHGNA